MKITFLGTSAATSYPLAFCKCAFCDQARRNGGKDFRKRSSVIVNNDLLIDFGPDVLSASFMYNIPLADVRYCLQTHSHSDHFDPAHLSTRVPEYLGVDAVPLEIYASRATLEKMSEMVKQEGYIGDLLDVNNQKRLNARIYPASHFELIKAGVYEILCLPSDHDRSVDSLIFSITDGRYSLLYATDTDTFRDDVWRELQRVAMRFDGVILDRTYGPGADGEGHLNAARFLSHIQRLNDLHLLSDKARVFATHISHEGNPPHDRLAAYAAARGYEIAYDGLCVDLGQMG